MKKNQINTWWVIFILLCNGPTLAQNTTTATPQSTMENNKLMARQFYQDLWFSNNTDNYYKYMAETYVAHDIGDRKGVREPAIEQKITADRFWQNDTLSGKIDYQIAEGDLVATRWHATFQPETLFGKLFGMQQIPIINVFRFKDGKIVELWNHRHDIDTNQTLKFTIKGLAIGLLVAMIPTLIAIRLRKKIKQLQTG